MEKFIIRATTTILEVLIPRDILLRCHSWKRG